VDPELLALFEAEMASNLAEFERIVLAIEADPTRNELANEAFRAAHNLKGGAGLLEMDDLGSLAHAAEELLEDVRAGRYVIDVPAVNQLLEVADVARALIVSVGGDTVERAKAIAGRIHEHRDRLRGAREPKVAESAVRESPATSAGKRPDPADPAAQRSVTRKPRTPRPVDDYAEVAQPEAAAPAASIAPERPATVAQASAPVVGHTEAVAVPAAGHAPSAPGAAAVHHAPAAHVAQAPSAPGAAAVHHAPTAHGAQAPAAHPAPAAAHHAPAVHHSPAVQQAASAEEHGGDHHEPAVHGARTPAGHGEHGAGPAAPARSGPAPAKTSGKADSDRTDTIRVRVDLLEELINYVGELVVARNRLKQLDDRTDSVREENTARIDELTTALHSLVMKTRMQPISTAWSVMTRLVRDLAQQLGKKVELHMQGGDTELDRNILSNLHDPIMHMVRNAVSHGIERPEDRVAAGKAAHGTVSLVAYHAAGQVYVEVVDDGRGLNRDRIAAKAVSIGLATRDEVAAMSDGQIYEFIFRPGFSTSEVVDAISGRGVGMDVVRRRIEEMGGAIDIETQLGQGTMLRFRLPLTLAIMPCLVVSAGGAEYCIPQPSLLQILDLETEFGRQAVATVSDMSFYRLDGALIPLVRLARLLRTERVAGPPRGYAVVVASGKLRFAIVVDDVLNTEEMVVKPLGVGLETLRYFSGTTVRGDGQVMLILDLDGIARTEVSEQATPQEVAARSVKLPERVLLLCDLAEDQRMGIDISHLISVRAVVDSHISALGTEKFVDYGGKPIAIRPLAGTSEGWTELLLCKAGHGILALPVLRTLDVVRTTSEISPDVGPSWAEGVCFIDGAATSVVANAALATHGNARHH
jgi:two-component system chemotaxis sensor kinase CheA